jgi:hypothetical protein
MSLIFLLRQYFADVQNQMDHVLDPRQPKAAEQAVVALSDTDDLFTVRDGPDTSNQNQGAPLDPSSHKEETDSISCRPNSTIDNKP